MRDGPSNVGLTEVELTAVVGGDALAVSAVSGTHVHIRLSPLSYRFPPDRKDDGMAMTVTPRGVEDDATAHNQTAINTHATADTSVSVAATGAIFRAVPFGSAALVVSVHGDIDIRSAPMLAEFASTRVDAQRHLVLDLSDVGFFGIAGLTVFSALDSATEEAGSSWSLVEGHPVHRLLEAASLQPAVQVFDRVADAVQAASKR